MMITEPTPVRLPAVDVRAVKPLCSRIHFQTRNRNRRA